MSLQHLGHQGDALQHGNIREPHQAGMLEAPDVHELSEVSVDGNQALASEAARSSSA